MAVGARIAARILVGAALALWAPAIAEAAQAGGTSKPAGLMWNRSGLPAVFPLQVRTPPGSDYMLTLVDVATGEEVLAAYISGGAFFRVLVPPGTFSLRFATGEVWQGDERLFGPGSETRVFQLPQPLTFETRGDSVKAGHVVDLRETATDPEAAPKVRAQFFCQTLQAGFEPAWQARNARKFRFLDVPGFEGRHPGVAPAEPFDLNAYRRFWDHALSYPTFTLRSKICD